MAHSAGAPYALSFANKSPERIVGDICLLAPWVGGSDSGELLSPQASNEGQPLIPAAGGYKWLKYVPNGILKTAQAAEWKIQAWMIGKPPTVAFEGIGYDAQRTARLTASARPSPASSNGHLNVVYSSQDKPRPSLGSVNISDYDDLGDFEGRFESRSTLGGAPSQLASHARTPSDNNSTLTKRKISKGFLRRLKGGSSNSQPQSPIEEKPLSTGKKLRNLRSMSSLKTRQRNPNHNQSRKSEPVNPKLPDHIGIEVGLGFDEIEWAKSIQLAPTRLNDHPPIVPIRSYSDGIYTRSSGRRSISFTSPRSSPSPLSTPASPAQSSFNASFIGASPGSAYQAALGNALIAASHSESANGTHNDLLQILNHDNQPLGFSYAAYPHKVQVWYGDKDEKIAENAVRWMERNMGKDRCFVKVVKGADHSLMYKSSVVVEVLECVSQFWRSRQSYLSHRRQ